MAPLRDYVSVLSASRGLFGVQYDTNAFGHGDHMFLHFLLGRHPEFRKLVEFGTFVGTTSLYLGMVARLRGPSDGNNVNILHTFDIRDWRSDAVRAAWLPNMAFHLADLEVPLLDEAATAAVRNADFLFVDGNNKPLEAALYAHLLPIGSGMLLHDWTYDHMRNQRFRHLERLGFEALYEDLAVQLNSCARFWIRRAALPCSCPVDEYVKTAESAQIFRCAEGLRAAVVDSWDECKRVGNLCTNPLIISDVQCLRIGDPES